MTENSQPNNTFSFRKITLYVIDILKDLLK